MLESLKQSSAVYNAVQRAAGVSIVKRWLAPTIAALAPGTIVDVGAGTGLYTDLVVDIGAYTAVDVDERRLQRLSDDFPGANTVVADARSLPFADRSFDFGICIAVAHHLPEVDPLLAELRRVTRERVLFWDPLWTKRLASRALWAIDQGAWPRTGTQLVNAFSHHFTDVRVADYTLLHQYVLLEGRPAPTEV